MTHWQPIETAPKDGTELLLANDRVMWFGRWVHHQVFVNGELQREWEHWEGHPWRALGFDGKEVKEATHWQPKPDFPANLQIAAEQGEN